MGKEPNRSAGQRQLSAAVLAGGESRRMGTDKAMIDVDGQPLVVHVAKRLQSISDDVFVVTKESLSIETPEVLDEFAERSPLSGIITALHAARHPLVFVCGCDMPFISTDLVVDLAERCDGIDAVVPRHDASLEPLHAVWSVACLPKLEDIWEDGERAVHRALERLDTRVVDVAEASSFANVNTPDDLPVIPPDLGL